MAGAEGIQWLLTLANTLNTIGDIMEKARGVHDKLPDVVKKRITDLLGSDTKEARRSIRDEILYGTAVYALHATETAEMTIFEAELRKEPRNKSKAEALVLFVAKGVEEFKRENKKFPRYKKGETSTGTEIGWTTYGEGIAWATKFLRELLSQRVTNDAAETFNKRIAFLDGKNVFSLIPPPKEPTSVIVNAKALGKKITTAQHANLVDLETTMESFRERAKQYRENRRR